MEREHFNIISYAFAHELLTFRKKLFSITKNDNESLLAGVKISQNLHIEKKSLLSDNIIFQLAISMCTTSSRIHFTVFYVYDI